jgi:hypothetical protein
MTRNIISHLILVNSTEIHCIQIRKELYFPIGIIVKKLTQYGFEITRFWMFY